MTNYLSAAEPLTFGTRREAGHRLATLLSGYQQLKPVVVGVAPEAMPVAAEIARELGAPLDTNAVAPLVSAGSATGRFGVAAEGGIAFFDPDRREQTEESPETVAAALVDTEDSLQHRSAVWHRGGRRPSLHGRTVLLVSEWLGDERLAAAAACAVRDRGAATVVFVTPRARYAAAMAVEDWVDEIVGLELVDHDLPPNALFEDSVPVSDELVQSLLRENRDALRAARGQGESR